MFILYSIEMKKTLNQKAFRRLVGRYLSGEGSESERRTVERYYDLFSSQEDILDGRDQAEVRSTGLRLKSVIDLRTGEGRHKVYPLWRKLTAAAVVLFGISAGLFFYPNQSSESKIVNSQGRNKADLVPGGNRAVLALSDGRRIALDGAHVGVLAGQQGVSVSKTASGTLEYTVAGRTNRAELLNSVSTPRGGQYRLRLSDGTGVWLNAGSVLTYPVAFGGNSRRVTLSGEAYFEVRTDTSRPFSVQTLQQKITVRGTHFNISAYGDDPETRTTLLEGQVSVTGLASGETRMLRPGQQALSSRDHKSNNLSVTHIDTAEAVAWKNGYFHFQDEGLESVLKKIARWYDLEILYPGNRIPQGVYFSGTLSKYQNGGQVLRKLELSGGVHFQMEGRRVMVRP